MQKHQHMFGSGVIFFQNTVDTMDMEGLLYLSLVNVLANSINIPKFII